MIEMPTIEIRPAADYGPLDRAIADLAAYDWLIFTSANGVRFFLERLPLPRRPARARRENLRHRPGHPRGRRGAAPQGRSDGRAARAEQLLKPSASMACCVCSLARGGYWSWWKPAATMDERGICRRLCVCEVDECIVTFTHPHVGLEAAGGGWV